VPLPLSALRRTIRPVGDLSHASPLARRAAEAPNTRGMSFIHGGWERARLRSSAVNGAVLRRYLGRSCCSRGSLNAHDAAQVARSCWHFAIATLVADGCSNGTS
jgi:hypothetical protein